MDTGTRTGISYLANDGSDAVSAYRTSIRNVVTFLEASGAIVGQGLLSARPTVGVAKRWYKPTDAGLESVIYFDDGTTWQTIGATAATDAAASVGSLRTLGSGALQAAAGNHSHGIGAIIGAGGAASLNVGTTAGTVAAGDHTHSGMVTASYIVKPTATTRTSTTTMADDPHLTLTLAASGTYKITARVLFLAGSTPKMKMNFGIGTGVTRTSWVMLGNDSTGTVRSGAQYTGFADVVTTGAGVSGLGDGYDCFRHELLVTTAASGTYFVTFRWAQNTSSATSATVYDNSVMFAEKIG